MSDQHQGSRAWARRAAASYRRNSIPVIERQQAAQRRAQAEAWLAGSPRRVPMDIVRCEGLDIDPDRLVLLADMPAGEHEGCPVHVLAVPSPTALAVRVCVAEGSLGPVLLRSALYGERVLGYTRTGAMSAPAAHFASGYRPPGGALLAGATDQTVSNRDVFRSPEPSGYRATQLRRLLHAWAVGDVDTVADLHWSY